MRIDRRRFFRLLARLLVGAAALFGVRSSSATAASEASEAKPWENPDQERWEDPNEVVVEAARVAQLHAAIQGFPKGWGTLLGERGVNLSGGQKQRTTLARAVARDPRILILDDALSAVDTHTEARILDDLARVMEGRTSFIISHRVSAVMNADMILVLDGGRIVERGQHADLMAVGGTYARLLHRQMLEQDIEATNLDGKVRPHPL